jgi:hypothetical protein
MRAITIEDDCGISEAKNGWQHAANDSADSRADPRQWRFLGSAHANFMGGVAKRRTDNYVVERVNCV